MRVYLVQRAEAMSKEQDPQRPQANEGRHATAMVAHFITPRLINYFRQ